MVANTSTASKAIGIATKRPAMAMSKAAAAATAMNVALGSIVTAAAGGTAFWTGDAEESAVMCGGKPIRERVCEEQGRQRFAVAPR